MKKIYILLIAFFLFGFISYADEVPIENARTVATNMYYLKTGISIEDTYIANEVTVSENGVPIYYAFNFGDNEGFVIVSSDDHAIPILGYAIDGSFAEPDIGIAFEAWMNNYKEQIVYLKEKKLESSTKIDSQWEFFSKYSTGTKDLMVIKGPLLAGIDWHQGAPYNGMVPTGYNGCPSPPPSTNRCAAGCGAIAFAQILRYHKHPNSGTGIVNYLDPGGANHNIDLDTASYNYDDMPGSGSSSKNERETLIYHVGVALSMDYCSDGCSSSSTPAAAQNAFISNFKYKNTANFIFPSQPNYENNLKNEIDLFRPIFYSGYDEDTLPAITPPPNDTIVTVAAHAFVCDGYDDLHSYGGSIQLCFHFNWGWSGPESYHPVSDIIAGGWNFSDVHFALVGIEPDWTTTSIKTWTAGANSTNWFDGNNWSPTGVPTNTDDLIIPELAPTLPYEPYIADPATIAHAKSIEIQSGGELTIGFKGKLTVEDWMNNIGTFIIKGDASGSGSLLMSHNINATFQRYYTGGEWHLISSPIISPTSGLFTGLYLQEHDEQNNTYSDIVPIDVTLKQMQGYALWNPSDGTAEFEGVLNNGLIGGGNNLTRNGLGWNLMGNPYPSAIDWDAGAGWTKTNVDNSTYIRVNSTTWASYVGGVGTNGGSRYIPACQGFFVRASATGTLKMTNDIRVHNDVTFYKSDVTDIVRLEVHGNDYTDETVIRFLEEATLGFDRQWDAYKLFGDVPEAPSIYSSENEMMSINSLPSTEMVPIGVKAGIPGLFTIYATETSDFENLVLEDLVTGIKTDLLINSYPFNYDLNNDDRFILHFTPFEVSDEMINLINIFQYDGELFVAVPENTTGEFIVYNIMGQEITAQKISGVLNKTSLDKSGCYIVKVICDKGISTKKVLAK